ncbi:MAG: hypothetical protein RIQ62_553 [Bacteroidota bacterium]|jgi:rhodanese-related sulfurtransferase
MISLLKKLFKPTPAVDYKTLVKNGAPIIDVRTQAEYQQGHIKGSVNIPLNELTNQSHQIKKNGPIITCCASGMRSAQARRILLSQGFSEVYNGGGWTTVQNKLA